MQASITYLGNFTVYFYTLSTRILFYFIEINRSLRCECFFISINFHLFPSVTLYSFI